MLETVVIDEIVIEMNESLNVGEAIAIETEVIAKIVMIDDIDTGMSQVVVVPL